MKIALVCFDDMEELDLLRPWDVLRMWQLQHPEDEVEVFTASLSGETVTCAKGMKIVTDGPASEIGDVDVLLLPGGRGTRALMNDGSTLEFLETHAGNDTLMASVCTGSLVFAAAGLLANRPATH